MEISISLITKKCEVCGKTKAGVLLKNLRLDRLPPVFFCESCLALAQAAQKRKKDGMEEGEEGILTPTRRKKAKKEETA